MNRGVKADRRATRARKSIVRDRRGGAAVEFAMICPLYAALFGGIVEASLLFNAQATMTHYAREAARGVALGYMTTTEAQTYLTTEFAGRFSFTIASTAVVNTPSGQPQRVTVTTTMDSTDIDALTVFGLLAPGSMNANVNMVVLKLKA